MILTTHVPGSHKQLFIAYTDQLWVVDQGYRIVGPFQTEVKAIQWVAINGGSADLPRPIEAPYSGKKHDDLENLVSPEEAVAA